MEAAHSVPVRDVLSRFDVSESCGLSPEQVRRNREKYGPNGERVGMGAPVG
uniref:Cation-transporting P-type ATPase N-terminal domain-containing protein n=1 Tax=Meleagris gallopavo TaxID=9103 RepID=A0A803YQD1_MELGA